MFWRTFAIGKVFVALQATWPHLFKTCIMLTGGGGTPHMKGVGMLVVSRRGLNFGFWSQLGCSGQNAIKFTREGLVKGRTRKNIKIYILSVF